MSKILDRNTASYSFALHILRALEIHTGDLALQGGLGISLAIDHTRLTNDIDFSVSFSCLMKLDAGLPNLVKQMFYKVPSRWTRCSIRDPEFKIHWGGQNRSRRLRVSWWLNDEATVKERIELQFYAVPEDVLCNYPTQQVSIFDEHTGKKLDFLIGMTCPITALADKIVAIINSPRIRLIDYVDAMALGKDLSDDDMASAARAIESIMSAYTDEPIGVLLRRCFTNRPVLDADELARQKLAISKKIPIDRIVEHVGDISRFNDTRVHILSVAFALLVGAAHLREGGPDLHTSRSSVSTSLSM